MSHINLLLGTLCLFFFLCQAKAELFELTTTGEVSFSVYDSGSKQELRGQFHSYRGQLDFDPILRRLNKVRVVLEVASLDTHDQQRDLLLKNDPTLLHLQKYPQITFVVPHQIKLSPNRGVETTGQLTIKGRTRPVMLALTYKGQRQQGHLFTATGRLSRREFDLNWNQLTVANLNGLSDQVQISVEALIKPSH